MSPRMPHAPVITPPKAGLKQAAKVTAISAVPAQQDTSQWDALRRTFAMPDCSGDASAADWARRYTRYPERFEQKLRAVLPQLAYVQEIARQYHVAGEFVLLPWVESHYQPVRGRANRPAGIWQIMPATARTLGLRTNSHYDARLDLALATTAVMQMLRQYQDRFHDWRVTDYAYNAGEFTARRLVEKLGAPAITPLVPAWPVRKVTREHLSKLLAMACIVRDPQRFGVALPEMAQDQQLVRVSVTRPMTLGEVARTAGMPLSTLKNLNAAYLNNRIEATTSAQLMLPAARAQQFGENQRQLTAAGSDQALAAPDHRSPVHPYTTHRVRTGESLWQIARHYAVSVAQLQRWNGLHRSRLKPGVVLRVSAIE